MSTPTVSRTVVCALAASLALVVHPTAQQTPPAQVTFRSGVDFVRVDVVVTDKDDKPITGLTKDDFEIVEKGRPQTISDFQFVSVLLPPQASSRSNALAVPPAPDVAANTAPAPTSRLFAMIVDDLHIIEANINDTKKVMREFIQALAPDDEAAIVFVSHSNLGQNVTRDRALLLKTVDHVKEALGFGLDALGASNSSDLLTPDPRFMARQAKAADSVLKNVALSLAGSGHARRAIIYVTSGSVINTTEGGSRPYPHDFDELQDAYETARRADVPIYTIDPRGMATAEDSVRGGISALGGIDVSGGGVGSKEGVGASSSTGGAPASSRNDGAKRALIAGNIRQQNHRLAEIAINTGGRHFTQQSDLVKAMREIVADNGSFYVLGYYPNPFEADGKYHTFTVTVNRPGVRVRARNGYTASTVDPPAGEAKPVLDAAMSSGVNVSALSLRAFAAPVTAGDKGVKTLVTIEVTYPAASDAAREFADDLAVSVVALDPDAKVKASSQQTEHFKGAIGGQHGGSILINEVVELPSQPLTLKIGVASRALGKAGTVQMPIDVPKPGDDKLQIAGVAIGIAGTAAPVLNGAVVTGLMAFQPETARSFTARDTLRVYGRAFWRGRDAPVVTLMVKGAPTTSITAKVTSTAGAKGSEGEFDATLPLSSLAPGRYVLSITGKLGNAKPVARDVPFEVR